MPRQVYSLSSSSSSGNQLVLHGPKAQVLRHVYQEVTVVAYCYTVIICVGEVSHYGCIERVHLD